MNSEHLILTLSCVNKPGIVSTVSTYLFEGGFNILEANHFDFLNRKRTVVFTE
jgi:formyltetrahydrofolate deformylase